MVSLQPALIVESAPDHLLLRLNRPEKRNALNAALVADLRLALLEESRNAAPRPVILTGNGSAFSAGADLELLKTLATRSKAENLEDSEHLKALFCQLINYPQPVIAAVNGPALAGGCGLTTACDLVIAENAATFGYPEVKIGFVAAIVMPLLVRGIGERRARELLLTGRTLSAAQAVEIGLIHKVCAPGKLLDEARALAAVLRANSPTALSLTKRELHDIGDLSFSDALNYGARLNAEVRATPDLHEGVAAFLEKRTPVWPSLKK